MCMRKISKGVVEAKLVIEALKSKGASSTGAAGFCWGEVKVLISILGAEIDQMSPPELLKKFEDVLVGKSGVEFFVKVFPKVAHGWTVRYKVEEQETVKKAEEAHQDLLEWFSKHVK